jgi:hypothetical protein
VLRGHCLRGNAVWPFEEAISAPASHHPSVVVASANGVNECDSAHAARGVECVCARRRKLCLTAVKLRACTRMQITAYRCVILRGGCASYYGRIVGDLLEWECRWIVILRGEPKSSLVGAGRDRPGKTRRATRQAKGTGRCLCEGTCSDSASSLYDAVCTSS